MNVPLTLQFSADESEHASHERTSPLKLSDSGSGNINAMSLAGGSIYLYLGSRFHARDEGELAGLIAHEIGHIKMRDTTELYAQYYTDHFAGNTMEKTSKCLSEERAFSGAGEASTVFRAEPPSHNA